MFPAGCLKAAALCRLNDEQIPSLEEQFPGFGGQEAPRGWVVSVRTPPGKAPSWALLPGGCPRCPGLGLGQAGACRRCPASSQRGGRRAPCELGLPGLLTPRQPLPECTTENHASASPACPLGFTLTSSCPRGKQSSTKPSGWKGQWSAPGLLLGWHTSHRAVPLSRCPAAPRGGQCIPRFQQLLSQALVTLREPWGAFPQVWAAP